MRNDAIPVISLHRSGGGSMVLGAPNSDFPVRLTHGAMGLGAAPVSFSTSPRLAGHGSVLRGKRLDERDIFLPVLIEAGSMSALNTVRDDLLRFVSPTDDRGLWLRVSVPGRDRYRQIRVHYAGGLDGDYGQGYHGNWQVLGLEFKAPEGLWYGEVEAPSFRVDGERKPLLSSEPFFPVELSDSTVDGVMRLDVAGDAPTSVHISIRPPGDSFKVTHLGTGESFTIEGLITEVVSVDMGTGYAPWERVSPDSRVFGLSPGVNELEIVMPGASESSLVTARYFPRYLAGY